VTFKQIIEVKWHCPYCSAKGIKWIRQRDAREIARDHVNKYHKEEKLNNYKSIIIEKRRRQNENTTNL
jgi:hypothetical protein